MHPPRGEEAEAQRLETLMPWVWLVLGLLVVIAFVAVLFAGGPSRLAGTPRESPTYSLLAHSR